MKTLFPFAAVAIILMSCSSSREIEQPTYSGRHQQSFYYYPSANVYYDGSCSRYIYQNGRSWITASILPSGLAIGNDRVQVYYNGPEVWRDNDRHRNTYYRQPVVVAPERRYDDRRDHRRHARYRDRDDY